MLKQSPKVFISYRRQDSPGHAGRLASDLIKEFGVRNVFIDIDTIEVGSDFVETIEKAINATDVLIVLIGKDWLKLAQEMAKQRGEQEDFARIEIAAGLRRNILVIPVLVEGAKMPLSQELSDDIRGLSRRNAIEISDQRWRYDINQLIDAIKKAPRRKVVSGDSSIRQSLEHQVPDQGRNLDSVSSKINIKRLTWILLTMIVCVGALWVLPWAIHQITSVQTQQNANLNRIYPSPAINPPPTPTPTPSPTPTPQPSIRELGVAAFTFPRERDYGRFVPDREVIYGDLTGDNQEEAVFTGVYHDLAPNSRIYELKGFIFTVQDGRPKLLTAFSPWTPDISPSWEGVVIRDEILIVSSTSHVASENVDIVSYRWNGSRLVRVGKSQRPR